MKSGKYFYLAPERSRSIFLLLLFLIGLSFNCAVLPEFNRADRERAIRIPEYSPYYGLKKRIAVLDFKNESPLGMDKMGSAIADMLITELVRSNRYTLLEHSRIDQIMQEQALGQSGAITEDTAPKVGQLLGVESIIVGRVLDARQETGAHKIDNEKKEWAVALKATIGIVQLSYRMINTSTGEILLADNVSATEIKPGFGVKTKDVDFENMHEFDQTVLGIAVRKAVAKMAQQIVDRVEVVDWIGKVVQAQADTVIYFTPGKGAGIQLEQLFDIYENLNFEKVDFQIEEKSGVPADTITVSQPKARVAVCGFIGDKVARAKVIHGGSINRGDVVKSVRQLPKNIE